MVNMYVLMLIV